MDFNTAMGCADKQDPTNGVTPERGPSPGRDQCHS